jgi:hypothetical protein
MTLGDSDFADRRIGTRRLGFGRRILRNRRSEERTRQVSDERRVGERRSHSRRRVLVERRTVPAQHPPESP